MNARAQLGLAVVLGCGLTLGSWCRVYSACSIILDSLYASFLSLVFLEILLAVNTLKRPNLTDNRAKGINSNMLLLKVLRMHIPNSSHFTMMVVMAEGICREEEDFMMICDTS